MTAPSLDTTFAPVRSQTAFEETMERIGTAIKLGLLEPGARLPAERDLCARLGISRSTLRQALTALVQSGYLYAARGRGGGTFVCDEPPGVELPSPALLAGWREACDERLAVELGAVSLACERGTPERLAPLERVVEEMPGLVEDFEAYRRADVRFHIGLAEASGSVRLVALATDAQSAMTDLIAHIPHPVEVLVRSNEQHVRVLDLVAHRNATAAVQLMTEHVQGTVHLLAGLLPAPGPGGH